MHHELRCTDVLGRDVTVDDVAWFGKIVADHGELNGQESAKEQTSVNRARNDVGTMTTAAD